MIEAKPAINQLTEEAEAHLTERLAAPAPQRLAAFRIETELVEALKRIHCFSKRIARLVVEETAPYTRQSLDHTAPADVKSGDTDA